MQAIQTKRLGWTNSRPSRVKAESSSGHKITLSWDECQDGNRSDEEAHGYAASVLVQKLGWFTATNYLIGGGFKDGYVFVFSDSNILAPKQEAPQS